MYLGRLDMFFMANNITDDKRVSVLLKVIGRTTFALLKNMLAPKDKSLYDLVAVPLRAKTASHCRCPAFIDMLLSVVFGVKARKRDLSEDHKMLAFSKAIEIARNMESPESKAKELKELPPTVQRVVAVQRVVER